MQKSSFFVYKKRKIDNSPDNVTPFSPTSVASPDSNKFKSEPRHEAFEVNHQWQSLNLPWWPYCSVPVRIRCPWEYFRELTRWKSRVFVGQLKHLSYRWSRPMLLPTTKNTLGWRINWIWPLWARVKIKSSFRHRQGPVRQATDPPSIQSSVSEVLRTFDSDISQKHQ